MPQEEHPQTAYAAGHVLLVGNSINRLCAGQSWEELLQSLTKQADPQAHRRRGDKPFTLFFEELRNRYVYREKGRPDEFMDAIGESFRALPSTPLHRRLMELPFREVFTTNYDYALEKSVAASENYALPSDDFGARETKFSLFRKRRAGGKNVWHIHGEAAMPTSIMLGHDHYTDYAAQARRYFYQGAVYRGTGAFRSGLQRDVGMFDQPSDGRPYSWVDLFVRDNVHIGGFSFDFSESLLWYLVSYRRRRRDIMLRAGVPLSPSEVTFYYFSDREPDPRRLSIVEVLESFDVRCVEIDRSKGGYAGGWENLIRRWETVLGVEKPPPEPPAPTPTPTPAPVLVPPPAAEDVKTFSREETQEAQKGF
ncbi:MAG TPA: SIR2 family protein [Opitutaceae bacterium]|nr:SIR2 family protein [Opitutaceae bacterium]